MTILPGQQFRLILHMPNQPILISSNSSESFISIKTTVFLELVSSLAFDQLFFGDAHPDIGDALRPLSFATVGSDIPPQYKSGHFGLLTYGIHWQLKPSLSFFFSGLGYHGSTAPISNTNEVAFYVHTIHVTISNIYIRWSLGPLASFLLLMLLGVSLMVHLTFN